MQSIVSHTLRHHTFITVLAGLFLFVSTAFSETGPPKVTCKVETDRDVLPAGPSHTAVIKVTLDAPPAPAHLARPAVNLSIVLDRSGSMGGEKIRKAQEAAIEAVKRLSREDIFSLVIYDDTMDTIIPAQNVLDIEPIISKIQMIRPGGGTALFGGVSQAASEIRKHLSGSYVHRIILLSDGLANVGPDTPEDLGRLGASLIKEDISVTTVGVGTDYNEDLMARLAQKSDGNTYFVEQSQDLPRIFTAELGDVLNVVAKSVKVIIETIDGVTPLSIIGREGRIKGKQVLLSMNQLYGAQQKFALVECALPDTQAGTKKEIARAVVTYEDPFTQKNERAESLKIATFSEDETEVRQSANISVIKDYQLNMNALAQEKAISLSDKGKTKEAVLTLKSSAAQLKSVGSAYKNEELLEQAATLEKKAEQIDQEGMSKKSRKLLRTESYQMKNQQGER